MPQNHLIEKLPRLDRARLLGVCRPVELVLAEVLCRPAERMRHVYFPVDGFVCLVADLDHRPGLEVGMIGREGMLGAHVALEVVRAPLQALVQGAGSAWRVDVAAFRRLLLQSVPLQRVMNRYVHVLMCQLASSVACLHHHRIAPRLARWLLMSQDRAHSDDFRVTQEFLGYVLGVRRVGVTVAASALQARGLIRYARGHMHVLDRPGLEASACSCYAADTAVYARHLPRGAPRAPAPPWSASVPASAPRRCPPPMPRRPAGVDRPRCAGAQTGGSAAAQAGLLSNRDPPP